MNQPRNSKPTADTAALLPVGHHPNEDRPCDRCPRKGAKTIHYAGGEYCLCSSCYDEIRNR